jgi:uncharacterized protein (TIGR03546 family)
MLTLLVKILKALNSEQSPSQLAIAVSIAAIMGLTPFLSMHNLVLVLFAMWFRVNLGLLIVSYPLFAILGWMFSAQLEAFGFSLLQMPELQDFWISLYNNLGGRWSGFYFSGRLGSLVVSLVLAIILFPIVRFGVIKYREVVLEKFNSSKLMLWLKATKFMHFYNA